ncbi:MAG: ABC transporter substrate-binding protein [Actinomycetota bacterium]|nr:ABC transporter substrate-binding protein [Actinomycetota bacterium]
MIRKFIPIALAVALVVSACGADISGDTDPPDTTTATTTPVDDGFPVTIAAPNGTVTIESRPERIVSISPTSTEVLFAVGAGAQVVAVDSLSNYPPNAPVTDLVAFTPNIEAIASYDPDLVFISFDPGEVAAGLEAIGIPVIVHEPAVSVDDAYAQWEQVGAATGQIAEAAAVVAETSLRLASAIESLPDGIDSLTYYYEVDPTYYSATSLTFIGGLLGLTEMRNIADEVDVDGFGFPQLTAEYIIDSDPGLILLADTRCCGASVVTIAERPGWDTLTAVVTGSVVELDDDIASRWGPRIAELLEDVVSAILELELTNA